MNENQVKIRAGYSQTVFEEPFKSQVFSIELEVIVPEDHMNVVILGAQHDCYNAVQKAIEQYAPKWKSFEDLQRMQKGFPPIGRKKDDEGDFLDA